MKLFKIFCVLNFILIGSLPVFSSEPASKNNSGSPGSESQSPGARKAGGETTEGQEGNKQKGDGLQAKGEAPPQDTHIVYMGPDMDGKDKAHCRVDGTTLCLQERAVKQNCASCHHFELPDFRETVTYIEKKEARLSITKINLELEKIKKTITDKKKLQELTDELNAEIKKNETVLKQLFAGKYKSLGTINSTLDKTFKITDLLDPLRRPMPLTLDAHTVLMKRENLEFLDEDVKDDSGEVIKGHNVTLEGSGSETGKVYFHFSSPRPRLDEKPAKSIKEDAGPCPNSIYFTFDELAFKENFIKEGQVISACTTALNKTLNSLSWKKDIVLAAPVKDNPRLLKVNTCKLGWTKSNQLAVLDDVSSGIQNLDKSKKNRVYSTIEFIRKSLVGNLYYDLLYRPILGARKGNTPYSLKQLLEKLEIPDPVNLDLNSIKYKLYRALTKSQVALARDRVVEVRELKNKNFDKCTQINDGWFWITYDQDVGSKGKLATPFEHPLGPKRFVKIGNLKVFIDEAIEFIFRLANGLNAYGLVDPAKGTFVNEAPNSVVIDGLESATMVGHPVKNPNILVNAVACMTCHDQGMNLFKPQILNELKEFEDLKNPLVRKLTDKLYGDRKKIVNALLESENTFVRAMAEIPVDAVKTNVNVREREEPISECFELLALGLANSKPGLPPPSDLP